MMPVLRACSSLHLPGSASFLEPGSGVYGLGVSAACQPEQVWRLQCHEAPGQIHWGSRVSFARARAERVM